MGDFEEILKNISEDEQDDMLYSKEMFHKIHIAGLDDRSLVGTIAQSTDEQALTKLVHPCYTKIPSVCPNVSMLHEETLFYIFYMCPGDRIQETVYYLLMDEGYFYCALLGYFFTFIDYAIAEKVRKGSALVVGNKYRIVIFDPFCWDKLTKDILLEKPVVDSIRFNAKDA